jgi:hypothetical protein
MAANNAVPQNEMRALIIFRLPFHAANSQPTPFPLRIVIPMNRMEISPAKLTC